MDAHELPGAAADASASESAAGLRATLEQSVRVVEAAFALLRSELKLAGSSALLLVWLGIALVCFGVGAWLAVSAAIAAGIYELTDNWFYGIGGIALLNLAGMGGVLFAMRGCWRDLALPRTRRMLGELGHVRP
ncbi:MAG TPA: hypothetical protein VGC30_03810 [Dokdonella sp.]